jgi:mycofactocin system creatininase family protein
VSALEAMTSSDAATRAQRVLVVPLGATEQHGPHLPLSTDTEIATALAERLAAARGDVVVAPAVPYGASGEHQGFPGTLSIGTAATRALIVELVRSATITWPRVLLLNAHGGNHEALLGAVDLLHSEGRDVRAWWPTWSGDAHAGHTETSLMLAIRPSSVRLSLAAAGAGEPVGALIGRLRAGGVAAVSPNGVLGDPAGASAEHGHALLAEALHSLAALVERWA